MLFFAVYDGHGGTEGSEYARQHLHSNIISHPDLNSDPETAIREGFFATEEGFRRDKCVPNRAIHGVGTTAVVALILSNTPNGESILYVAHVGDSEAILCKKGKPIELTTPHNLKNPKERKRIEEVGGVIWNDRLAHPVWNPKFINIGVTRAIGDRYFKDTEYTEGKASGLIAEPEINKVLLTIDDKFILLASDGFWDVVDKQTAIDYILQETNKDKETNMICKELTDMALRKRSLDDTTVLLIKLKH